MIILGEGARQTVAWSREPRNLAFAPWRRTTQQGSWLQWYQERPIAKEALVPDHLGDDVEADLDEPLGDRRGVDTGTPGIADLELWDEGEGE
jgi:hypothetical protein